jgi:predicted O-methyltransferase YrrM
MDFTRYYHIAFAHHRIMNPLSDEVLSVIGKHALPGGGAVLDIGSGKGYASLLYAREFGARTTQVDVSEQWTSSARRLFADEGLDRLATIHTMDADKFLIDQGAYDLILCCGTTPVYGGFSEALARLRDGLTDGGMIAVGEISCEGVLPKPLRSYLYRHEWRIYQMKELLDAVHGNGLEPVFVFRSSPREWDFYMSLQWKAMRDFIRDNPEDPDTASFRAYMLEEQEMFLRFQRHAVDWNVFALRKR